MPNTSEEKVELGVRIRDIELRNPLILASGILGEKAALLLSAFNAGAGAVVTKSIGSEPREGHRNPTVFQYSFGLLNAMGLPNPGIDEFQTEMDKLRGSGAILIGSIFGSTAEEFATLASKMGSYGASAIELNLSCPHAKGFGAEIGSDPKKVQQIAQEVKASIKIPLLAKLTPNTSDIVSLGLAAQDGGADAVVAINTVKGMGIDPRLRKPVLGNVFGGLSGEAIKPIGLRCVFELYDSLKIPVIGVGGIWSGIDVAEYIMAGATAVEIGSVIQSKGLDAFSEISQELKLFMHEEGFDKISDMRGIAHE